MCCGRILSAPTVWVGKLLPFSEQLGCVHFGRLRASPTGLRSFRFSLCTLPGGSGNQRIDTSPVRHYPAELPPGSEAFGFLCVRYRAGSGTNVWVQSLCVTVWRHCRPPLQPQNVLQIINSCANYLFSVLKFGYSMDIIAYVIFVIGKLNHWQISRLSEKQSYGAARCGCQLQILR